ncbi:MAG TPA: ABC transporter ATP-binding protein [Propionibacteriaceae bacterium]
MTELTTTELTTGADTGTEAVTARPAGPVTPDLAEVPQTRPVRPDAVLRVDRLRVAFTGAHGPAAVDDVSFSVGRGEVLALVGESGSGKTVTAQAILGLLPGSAQASGSIQLTSDPERLPAHEQPNLIGGGEEAWHGVRGRTAAMVFQEPQTALNPVKTVGWQLAEAVRAHQRVSRRAAQARAVELLELVGLPEAARRASAYPHQLSGGQKQRVVIALALANDPVLLIADEPTTALDVTVQAEILTLLRDLRDRLGTAILLITHNMGVVADLADRVLVMRGGRMVERGEVVSLFLGPFTPYTRNLLAAVPRLPGADDGPARERTSTGAENHPPALELTGVSVDYPGRLGKPAFRALHDLTVGVQPGAVLGVVGESGSSKSTLARAVSGQLPVATGQVLVAGRDLATLDRAGLRSVRRELGVVHQDPATTLDPLLSISDSIAEPLLVHRVAQGAELRTRVRRLLADVALPAYVERRRPHELSGGQRQRVALARALALRPALLIADEPTSALDVTVQAAILALFADLRTEYGFACVFISHDLAVINDVSDEVLVLKDGRVVEQGTARDVLSHPTQDYTRRLLDAVPVPDPVEQRARTCGAEA